MKDLMSCVPKMRKKYARNAEVDAAEVDFFMSEVVPAPEKLTRKEREVIEGVLRHRDQPWQRMKGTVREPCAYVVSTRASFARRREAKGRSGPKRRTGRARATGW